MEWRFGLAAHLSARDPRTQVDRHPARNSRSETAGLASSTRDTQSPLDRHTTNSKPRKFGLAQLP